jgi:hypothetical protein
LAPSTQTRQVFIPLGLKDTGTGAFRKCRPYSRATELPRQDYLACKVSLYPPPPPLYHKRVTLYTMQWFSTPQIISPERISRHLCIFSPIHPRVVFSKYDQATQSFTQRLVASSLADVNQPCCSSLGSALVSERSPLFLFELWQKVNSSRRVKRNARRQPNQSTQARGLWGVFPRPLTFEDSILRASSP